MQNAIQRAIAKRVFEETLATTLQHYGPPREEGTIDCVINGPNGTRVLIARYTLYPDGRIIEKV